MIAFPSCWALSGEIEGAEFARPVPHPETIIMFAGVALGAYHTGVEWKLWAGPAECTGPISDFGSAGNLLKQMQTTSVVRCDEAAWRLLGLSLAGYNVLISAALAIVALSAVVINQREEKI